MNHIYKLVFVTVILSGLSSSSFAQIENEIKSFVDSTELIVNKGRKMMMYNISKGDFRKAKEVYHYLTEKTENQNYTAFNYNEDLYFNALAADWEHMKKLLLDVEKLQMKFNYPETYELEYFMFDLLAEKRDSLLTVLQKEVKDEESREIITLYLMLMDRDMDQSAYDKRLKMFLKKFKHSPYNDFVELYLPEKSIESTLGLSFGSGVVYPTKDIARDVHSGPLGTMSVDFKFNRLYTSLYFQATKLRLKDPFTVYWAADDSLAFRKDEKFSYLDAGLKVGYLLVKSDYFHLGTFGSISGCSLQSDRYDSEDDDLEYTILDSFSMGAGLHSEVILYKVKDRNDKYVPDLGYFSLKMDAGYNHLVKYKDDVATGSTPYITLALAWSFGTL